MRALVELGADLAHAGARCATATRATFGEPFLPANGKVTRSWAAAVMACAARPARWLAADPARLLTLAWLVGLIMVGHARAATAATLAAPGGIIVGPDLADGAPRTLFETYDFTTYELTVRPDDDASGWFGAGAGVLHIVGVINNLLLWVLLGLLYGALTLLEWLLHLTVYQDSAAEIDAAARRVAAEVFWPLIGATAAIGAFVAYARWRADGRGYLSDLAWVLGAAAIGAVFATAPSTIMMQVDGARQDIAASVTVGAADYTGTAGNPVGFDQPTITGDARVVGTRTLVDSLWNTFGGAAWCYAQFHDLDICRVAGAHALADDDQWQRWMQILDDEGAVAEFREHGDWIRGQDIARTGYLLALLVIVVPLAVFLLRLVVAGLVAVTGLVLALIVALVLLVLWPIPGWCRTVGTGALVWVLGFELQALFITVIVAAVMVGSTIISTLSGDYGFFIVAILNLALLMAAARARDWLDSLTTTGGARHMGFATVLMTRSVMRVVTRGVGGTVGVAGRAAAATFAGARQVGASPGWGDQPGAHTTRWTERAAGFRTGVTDLADDSEPVRAQAHRQSSQGAALPASPRVDRSDASQGGDKTSDAGPPARAARIVRSERADRPGPSRPSGSTGATESRLSPLTDSSEHPRDAATTDRAGAKGTTARRPRARRSLPPGRTQDKS